MTIADCSGFHLVRTLKPPNRETAQSVSIWQRETLSGPIPLLPYCPYGARKHSLLSRLNFSFFNLCLLPLWLPAQLCRVHCLLSDIPIGTGVQLGTPKASSALRWLSLATPDGCPCSASRLFGTESMELRYSTSLRLFGPAWFPLTLNS